MLISALRDTEVCRFEGEIMADQIASASVQEVLAWSVKTSFRRYIRASGGTITVTEPARDDGIFFFFPTSSDQPAPTERHFEGGVSFAAHFGALDLTLVDLAIVFVGAEAVLTVRHPEASGDDDRRVTMAKLSPSLSEGADESELSPRLTEEGAALFGGFYPAETVLDPITFARIDVESAP